MNYESVVERESVCRAGVRFKVRRMSFARRAELAAKLRELAAKYEFLDAGKEPREQIEAAMVAAEVEKTYLEWGLVEIQGLEIDETPATPQKLVLDGPEDLCREIVAAVKAEAGLDAAERKN